MSSLRILFSLLKAAFVFLKLIQKPEEDSKEKSNSKE